MKPLAIDLFSGCGGLSLGLSQAGFDHLFAVEAHPDPFSTYEKNLILGTEYESRWPRWLPRQPHDIRNLLDEHADELLDLRGTIDVVAGGPPCQGFSTNGRRDPSDPRSSMIDAYMDFVATVRPRLVLLENVQGFASMPHPEGGCYPDHARRRLNAIGYEAWDTMVVASDWGVPQRRPRYILIAAPENSLPGIDPIERLRVFRKSFLKELGLWPVPVSTKQALHDLTTEGKNTRPDPEWGHSGFRELDYQESKTDTPYIRLMREGFTGRPTDMRLARHTPNKIALLNEILETCEKGRVISSADRERLGIKKRSTTPIDPNAPSPTITTLPDDLIHYSEPRTMTVREHARLQSFPDWFSFQGRYTAGGISRRTACPRYTQVGNAVPPLLGRALGGVLVSLLRDQKLMDCSDGFQVRQKNPPQLRKVIRGHDDVLV